MGSLAEAGTNVLCIYISMQHYTQVVNAHRNKLNINPCNVSNNCKWNSFERANVVMGVSNRVNSPYLPIH